MKNGYSVIKRFLNCAELKELDGAINRFHKLWLKNNRETYKSGAVNSAYLTSSKTTNSADREFMFSLISSTKILEQLNKRVSEDFCFLNTQLFFDPLNKEQKNYWHRDIQYTDSSIENQKKIITEKPNNIVHFRIALKDERGIELIPKTNFRWDTITENEVRNSLNNRNTWDDLPGSEVVKLERGDLLIFSANMIHRGLYGDDRFAFDILYCEPDPEIIKYMDVFCSPSKNELKQIKNKHIFYNGPTALSVN